MTDVCTALPAAVSSLALRCGASRHQRGAEVVLSLSGFLKERPADRPTPYTAAETLQLRSAEFVWSAKCDPINMLVVRDQLVGDEGRLSLLAFGAVPLSAAKSGAAVTRAEVMRYLADLAWAPDAILHNEALSWTEIDGRTLKVVAGQGEGRAEVLLRLGDDGLIASAEADDRPRWEHGAFAARPWRVRFSGHQERHGRLTPSHAETSWVLDSGSFVCCLAELESWRIQ